MSLYYRKICCVYFLSTVISNFILINLQGREEVPQCAAACRLWIRARRNQTAHHRGRHVVDVIENAAAPRRRRRLCLGQQFFCLLLLCAARSVRDVPSQCGQVLFAFWPGLPEQERPADGHCAGWDSEVDSIWSPDRGAGVDSGRG